ncbi:MAG: ATP-binding protein [Bacteroidales bacterium]|nr:ATP-binding protein [Bacteroidales bacterium]
MFMARMFPIGMQTFSKIRESNAIYVDKTALVYKLAHDAPVYFLARPRRFGKSLLISTLDDYFSGRKELFKGLAIDSLETEWKKHPVLRFDFSQMKFQKQGDLEQLLDRQLSEYETLYGIEIGKTKPSLRLQNIILAAKQKFGERVVFLVDEYDAPLLDTLVDKATFEDMRQTLRDFYSPLKSLDPHLRFIFITGITKFSQLSIFSELNNLKIISMLDEYADICGITEEELHTQMRPEIEAMATATGRTFEQTCAALKKKYDGYHFSKKSPDIYNPFSVMNALQDRELTNYWFETGTPMHLIEQMKKFRIAPEEIAKGIEATADMFNVPAESSANPMPVLYQSGYLTIKGFRQRGDIYKLAIPNEEVSEGLFKSLLPHYAGIDKSKSDTFIIRFTDALYDGKLDDAMQMLRAFLSSIPYDAERQDEDHYKTIFYLLIRMSTPFVTQTEVRSAAGRADAIVETDDSVYVFEFKLDKAATIDDALNQIGDKGYLIPYSVTKKADGTPKKLVKVGVVIDHEKRTIGQWKAIEA